MYGIFTHIWLILMVHVAMICHTWILWVIEGMIVFNSPLIKPYFLDGVALDFHGFPPPHL